MPWGFIIFLVAGLFVGWIALVLFTTWILSHPPRRAYGFALARNLPGDPSEITLPSTSGQLRRGLPFNQWTFRSRRAGGCELPVWDVTGLNPSGPTVIITHGWGDSRVIMLSRLVGLASMASRIVMWDLPAHGDAPKGGFTLGASEHEDLIALIDALGVERPSDSTPLILYGASLGAGASIVAAAELARRAGPPVHLAAVIAEAPYRIPPVPARNVFRLRGMPFRSNILPAMALLGLRFGRGLSWALSPNAGGFDRTRHAAQLSASLPLLVLHGELDPVCPLDDGRAIAAAAPNAHIAIIPIAGHNNLWTDPDFAPQCAAAIRDLMPNIAAAHASRSTN